MPLEVFNLHPDFRVVSVLHNICSRAIVCSRAKYVPLGTTDRTGNSPDEEDPPITTHCFLPIYKLETKTIY